MGHPKKIQYNDFKYMDYGVSLASCDQEDVSIESNTFNVISPPPSINSERAITLWSTHLNDLGSRSIKNNLIKNYKRGILVTNQTKRTGSANAVEVIENSIYLNNPSHSDMWYGIRVQAGSDNLIKGNLAGTTATSVSGMEKTVYGISVDKSENNIVSENSIVNCGTGLRFLGTGVKNVVSCNSLSGSYRQVTMDESFIDNQGSNTEASDNEWNRGSNTNANICAINLPSTFNWYVQSSSGSYYPGSGSGEMEPNNYYGITTGIDPSTTCNAPCTTPDCIQSIIAKIVKAEGAYGDYSEAELYNIKRFAFEKLSKDTMLMYLENANDSILKIFYQAMKEGNIDLLTKVKDFLQDNDSANAEITNSSLAPDNFKEENEKVFNELYLSTWAKYNIVLDSATIVNLEEIAYQNPLSGGVSIYGARVMLNLDLSDNSEEEIGRFRSPISAMGNNSSSNFGFGKIYPNPNTGQMAFKLKERPVNRGILEIYNLLGNLVKLIEILPNSEQIEIDISGFPAGIYPYRITLDGSRVYDKIILQK